MKIPLRLRILAATVAGGLVLGSSACGVDSLEQATAPRSVAPSLSAGAARGSTPRGASPTTSAGTFPDMAQDGTYTVVLDPTVANVLTFGASRLDVPANSMCAVGTSSYGPAYWNDPCALQSRTVQLTITVSTTSLGTSVDFDPALRFDPSRTVSLTLSAPQVRVQDARNWVILYCPTATSTTSGNGSGGSGGGSDGDKCVNEALTDKDLQTVVDYDRHQLVRRIKHFSRYAVSYWSGYVVGE